MEREEIQGHIHENLGGHVAAIAEMLRQRSVSLETTGLVECQPYRAASAQIGCTDEPLVEVGDGLPSALRRRTIRTIRPSSASGFRRAPV